MSHDLMLSIIGVLNGRITRVLINDLIDSTFYATIDIDTPKGTKSIDARPSDALAIAVRAKCPIFVDGGALEGLVDSDETPKLEATETELAPDDLEGEVSEESEEEVQRFKRLLGEE